MVRESRALSRFELCAIIPNYQAKYAYWASSGMAALEDRNDILIVKKEIILAQ